MTQTDAEFSTQIMQTVLIVLLVLVQHDLFYLNNKYEPDCLYNLSCCVLLIFVYCKIQVQRPHLGIEYFVSGRFTFL